MKKYVADSTGIRSYHKHDRSVTRDGKKTTLAHQSLQYYPLFLYFKTEQEPLFCFWLFGICPGYCSAVLGTGRHTALHPLSKLVPRREISSLNLVPYSPAALTFQQACLPGGDKMQTRGAELKDLHVYQVPR